MTEPVNGRPATQSDVFQMGVRIERRFDRLEERYDQRMADHEERLRETEATLRRRVAHDEAIAAVKASERNVKAEQRESRRWLIALTVGVLVAIASNFLGLVR